MSVSKRNGSKYFYIQFQYNGRTYIKSSKTPDKQLALNLEAQWRKHKRFLMGAAFWTVFINNFNEQLSIILFKIVQF